MILGNMIGFEGIIEDINDPEGANRVKVRVLGIHTDNKSLIPTDDFPWMSVGMSTSNAGVSGIGSSPHGLVQGSLVGGHFRDGADMQQPLVTYVILGVPEDKANPSKGFNDPDGVYPTKVGESDVNRLARGVTKDTVIEKNNNTLTKGVVESDGDTWDEPKSPYAAKYPSNKVHESESGHVHEVDDTKGAERINTRHKAGTGTEIHPDGTEVHRIIGDGFAIYSKDNKVLVKGVCSITVEKDCKLKVKGKMDAEVDGTLDARVKGNVTVSAPNIELGIDSSEPMVMGDKLANWIKGTLKGWLDSHTHPFQHGTDPSSSHFFIGETKAPSPFSVGEAAEGGNVYSKKNKTQK